jgi:triphosphoribosyl-dephospho-CoA synthase
MALAAGRDRIAEAYVTDFAEIFSLGLPRLEAVRKLTDDFSLMVTTLHMAYLAHRPDSHIARKFGLDVAVAVQQEAAECSPLWDPVAHGGAFAALLALDTSLKARGLNPGTTADFVVATLFAASLRRQLALEGAS